MEQPWQIADAIFSALAKSQRKARDPRCFELAAAILGERGEERGWKIAELADQIQGAIDMYVADSETDESRVERGNRELGAF